MIVCGWCDSATEPGQCSYCGRDPALPWTQRNSEPPRVSEPRVGRPTLDAGQIRQKVRIARKELGKDASWADVAEHLDVSDSTLRSWRKIAGL